MSFGTFFYLLLAAIGAYAAITAHSFKASFYPETLGIILCVCSLIQLARTLVKCKKAECKKLTPQQLAVIWTMLSMLAYILLLKPLGFVIASVLLMAGLMWLHGYRYPWRIAAISLSTALGLYLFFSRVIHIGLPRGLLSF